MKCEISDIIKERGLHKQKNEPSAQKTAIDITISRVIIKQLKSLCHYVRLKVEGHSGMN